MQINITYEKIQPTSQTARLSTLIGAIYAELTVPAMYYPGFNDWVNKVVQELTARRRSFILAKSQNKIVGISILKHYKEENKLCTFWVNPEFRRRHIASELLTRSLNSFEGKEPIITIPESRMGEFDFLIKRRDFVYRKVNYGLYHENMKEYFFTVPYQPSVSQGFSIGKMLNWCSFVVPSLVSHRAMPLAWV